jgi:hypothetical protein
MKLLFGKITSKVRKLFFIAYIYRIYMIIPVGAGSHHIENIWSYISKGCLFCDAED